MVGHHSSGSSYTHLLRLVLDGDVNVDRDVGNVLKLVCTLAYVFDDNIFDTMSARLSSVRTLIVIVSPSFSASCTNLTRRRMYIDLLSDFPAVALKTPPALPHVAGDALSCGYATRTPS
jgi:hypothetical protein